MKQHDPFPILVVISLLMLSIILFFSMSWAGEREQKGWSNEALLKSTCEIAFAYYDNNLMLMTSLIDAYGDPVEFDHKRIGKIRQLMKFRNQTRTRLSKFQCDARYDEQERIVMHGSLQLDYPGGQSDVSLNWGFIVHNGLFFRIVLDETAFDNSKTFGTKKARNI